MLFNSNYTQATSYSLLFFLIFFSLSILAQPIDDELGSIPDEKHPSNRGLANFDNLDQKLLRIAEKLPDFGGLFFDKNGELNIYLKNDHPQPRIERALKHGLGKGLSRSSLKNPFYKVEEKLLDTKINVLKGKYNYKQFVTWKNLLEKEIFSVDGVNYLDIDEATNHITIGASNIDADSELEIRNHLINLDIPQEAVSIETMSEAVKLISLRETQPTDNQPSGIVISNGSGVCTLGPKVWAGEYGSTYGFLTNDHCTSKFGEVTYDRIYQANNADQSAFIGIESFNPKLIFRDPFRGYKYYLGDFAFIQTNGGDNSRNIADTVVMNTDPTTNTHAYEINDSRAFKAVSEEHEAYVGSPMHKVGRTTGLTYGYVSKTCVNLRSGKSKIIHLCNNIVERVDDSYPINGSGDSGAAVFEAYDGDRVKLHGVAWGGTDLDFTDVFGRQYFKKFLYTPMANIREEFNRQGWDLDTLY